MPTRRAAHIRLLVPLAVFMAVLSGCSQPDQLVRSIWDRVGQGPGGWVPGPFISTVAGGGTVYSDGVPATTTALNLPNDVAADDSGNLYIADTNSCTVRKVDTGGYITTIAGIANSSGLTVDAQLATSTKLAQPYAIAVHNATGGGVEVYIADNVNNRVLKVDTTGYIHYFAGNGTTGSTTDGELATSAQLNQPDGLAVDSSGNVYIAEWAGNRIWRVDTGGYIHYFGGTGAAGFTGDGSPATSAQIYGPAGLVFDSSNNILYFADSVNNRVRMIDASGTIQTVAGNGGTVYSGDGVLATATALHNPLGVTLDSSGNLYIGDTYDNRVRKVNLSSRIITTFAGNGTASFAGDQGVATAAELWYPEGLAFAAGALYIADLNNKRIRSVK